MTQAERIVLMPPNWLGDVIMAQPALRSIAKHYPNAEIEVFGRTWLADLLPFLNLEHDNVVFTPELTKKSDKIFLFPNSLRSALQACSSRGKQRIGFRREGRGILLTHPYTSNVDLMHEHHRGYYLDLLKQYGVPTPFDDVQLATPDAEQASATEQLKAQAMNPDKYICVAPGAQFGGAKRYPAAYYASVLAKLSEDGWDIVLLGTPAEQDIAIECMRNVSGKVWNATGQTSLRQALQLVSSCHLMLCNDSGLMHVAAGMGIATVCMFGATDPARTSPSGEKLKVLYQPASCSPCLQRECDVLGHPCMANIMPEMVYQACLDLLEPNRD
ncbi:MAG: lipopolysaccharide heptosyltransferase II [Ghiorsea sp.]